MILWSILYSNRQRKGCGNAPPQTINYEEIIPPGPSTNPKTDAAPMPHEPSSFQLANNMAYWDVRKTEQHKERDPNRNNQAVLLEAYGQKIKP